jgi:hypothetical protein
MPSYVNRVGNNLAGGGFTPEKWSLQLNAVFWAVSNLMQIANTNWEGEIKANGSVVNIRQSPLISTYDYSAGGTIQYQDLTDDYVSLRIDRAKGWAITRDNIDEVQNDINVFKEVATNAAIQSKLDIEKLIYSLAYADAGNTVASTALTSANVINWIVQQGVIMNENNLPDDGKRWILVPPSIAGLIATSDIKNQYMTGDTKQVMRESFANDNIGTVYGINVFVSNQLTKTGNTFQCMSGHPAAITFANQFSEVETGNLPNSHGKYLRGLNLFGFKTVKPSALIYAPATLG